MREAIAGSNSIEQVIDTNRVGKGFYQMHVTIALAAHGWTVFTTYMQQDRAAAQRQQDAFARMGRVPGSAQPG